MMLRKHKPKIDLIDQITLELSSQQPADYYLNPEIQAKNCLIQISDQQVDQNFLETQTYRQNVGRRLSETFRVKDFKVAPQGQRVSVAEHFTQSHRIWRKKSTKLLEYQPASPSQQQQPKNQSSFIIFENGYLNNFNPVEQNPQITFGKAFIRTTKAKPSRNIMSLIKRKNIANIKQHIKFQNQLKEQTIKSPKSKRSLSPTQRISKSCELRKDWQQISPIKITTSDKIVQSVQLQCTNYNFRNKKLYNYIKMRANANRNSKSKLQ